jgi:hypothetical protein
MTTNVSFKSSRCFWVDEDVEFGFLSRVCVFRYDGCGAEQKALAMKN